MGKIKGKRNPFELLTSGYLFLLITLFLFYWGSGGYEGIVAAKFGAFCWICGGYVVLMTVLALERRLVGDLQFFSPKEIFRRSSWAQRFVILFLLLTWASALLSPYFPETIRGVSRYEGALTVTIYCLSFLLVSVYGRVNVFLLGTLGISVTLFGILCILQLNGRNPFGLYPAGYRYHDAGIAYSGAYLGTVGNVDLVAAFYSLIAPMLLVAIIRLRGGLRFLLLIPLGISLYVVYAMWVMAGLVGTVLGCILSLPAVLPLAGKTRGLLAGTMACAGILAIALLYAVDPGTGMLHEIHELLHGNFDGTFGSGRLHIWGNVFQSCRENPLLGTGPDTMLYGELEAFTRYDQTLDKLIVSQIDVAHNEYLNIFYHQGIFALIAYLVALALLVKKWILRSRESAGTAILGAGALGYGIQAFFGFSMCITAPFFWMVLALLEENGERKRGGQQYVEKTS